MSGAARTQPNRTGLKEWMDCVLERIAKARPDLEEKTVHDVRVALRRCRTMADAFREVSPDSSWPKIKKLSRASFHSLGALRDVQIQRAWVGKLTSPGDSARRALLKSLRVQERRLRKDTARELDDFKSKQWRKLGERVESESKFFPPESVVFQRLALKQLLESIATYHKARKTRGSLAWHRTRIELKKFRYLVENFLPERHEAWSADLKGVQDLLGDVHDLDVFRQALRRLSRKSPALSTQEIIRRIADIRKERAAMAIAKLSGSHSLFEKWLSGFHPGRALVAASFRAAERRTA